MSANVAVKPRESGCRQVHDDFCPGARHHQTVGERHIGIRPPRIIRLRALRDGYHARQAVLLNAGRHEGRGVVLGGAGFQGCPLEEGAVAKTHDGPLPDEREQCDLFGGQTAQQFRLTHVDAQFDQHFVFAGGDVFVTTLRKQTQDVISTCNHIRVDKQQLCAVCLEEFVNQSVPGHRNDGAPGNMTELDGDAVLQCHRHERGQRVSQFDTELSVVSWNAYENTSAFKTYTLFFSHKTPLRQ